MNKITIEGLTKRIKGNIILDNINIELHGGKIYGLVGRNGFRKNHADQKHCRSDETV